MIRSFFSVICVLTLAGSAIGDEIVFTNTSGELGAVTGFDGASTSGTSFAVPDFTALFITLENVTSSDANPRGNANATRFGVDTDRTSVNGDDSDQFDSTFMESITFSFNQQVTITELDFVSFDDADVFEFAGVEILGTSGNLNSNDVLDLSSAPIVLAANQSFTMTATSGSIGFQSMDLTAVPEPSLLSLFPVICSLGLYRVRRSK